MTKQKGRLLLIKIGSGTEIETFAPLCGLTTTKLGMNNNAVDVTTPDLTAPEGPLWREVMTGIRSMEVSGNGYFEKQASETRLLEVAHPADAAAGEAIANFEVVVPGLGTFKGAFHVDSVEYGGEQEGGVTYNLALSSAGAITFTAEPAA